MIHHGVTKIAAYGHSHGGGAVTLLMDALVRAKTQGDKLFNQAFSDFVANNSMPRVIWTGYIDAVHIVYDANSADASGEQTPEPALPTATERLFSLYETATAIPHGTAIGNIPAGVRVDYNFDVDNPPAPYHWNYKVYHSSDKKKNEIGIDVDPQVNDLLWTSFIDAAANSN